MQKNAFIIAGVSSGSGKTTVTLGLMAALKKKGLNVQPFKAGPDYIDPSHHTALCGRPSYNLDTWMMGQEAVKRTFARTMQDADVGIVEGVMGLFDGKGGQNIEGSTAHLAKILRIPVVLIIDAAGMAGSVAAIVSGFEQFDRMVNIAGVIFNRVGSERHFAMLKEAVERACRARVLGYLPKNIQETIPERHLGLIMAEESGPASCDALAELLEGRIDLDSLLDCCLIELPPDTAEKKVSKGSPVTIAVARDRAFCFYYRENLDLLEAFGARLVFFSLLEDEALPEGTSGIYIGGGYPELHAEGLEKGTGIKTAIREFVETGGPLYAECGGLMYLGTSVIDLEGKSYEMAGLLPWLSRMLRKRRSLGYREVEMTGDNPFLGQGEKIRGHEFHYSEIDPEGELECVYSVTDSGGKRSEEGYRYKNCLASYVHLHFASNPKFAEGFVNRCRDQSYPVNK